MIWYELMGDQPCHSYKQVFVSSYWFDNSHDREAHQNVSVVQRLAESALLILPDWIEVNQMMRVDNI